jgi:alpha-L-fucosidase
MNRFLGLLTLAGVVFFNTPPAHAYEPTPANLAARKWFEEARFGLFIHWGVYSVLGNGEWVMNNTKMTVAEYEKLPAQFNPTEFNATEWVAMAKAAGMKYITITSKHHDGFAMFQTKLSPWNIVDSTPYKKDPLKALAEECRRQGIKLFFYHSQLDWHHPDYYPRGRTGQTAGRPESGEWFHYLDFMDGQLRELLTNYGEIGGIWFDGWWDKPDADWRLDKTYTLIHELQPAALVGSNHHRAPKPGEDFQMWERDLPGGRTASFNSDAKIGDLPLETCDTINGAWGYNKDDKRFKSTRDLIHYLARAASNNANFLLNIGPMPNGKIQPEFVQRLAEMGDWMSKYGESIYGTRGGPIPARPWGVSTQKGDRVYLHVFDWPENHLVIPKLPRRVRGASLLNRQLPVFHSEVQGEEFLQLPEGVRDTFDTVIAIDLFPAEAGTGTVEKRR